MNKYLRFYSPSLAPAGSEQYVLVNVSKMTIINTGAGGVGDFDVVFHYGASKDFKLTLTFTPDLGAFANVFVTYLTNIIAELCAESNRNVYADVGTKDGIKVPIGIAGVVFNVVLTEIIRST